MRIVKFTAENVKRLRAVEIVPEGNTVVIAGANGAGKSSILDAIWLALGGGPATKSTPRPVRDGQKTAHVTLDLGDLVVTRRWTGDKSTLKVEGAAGTRYTSPQAVLDELVGRLTFDPLAFMRERPIDQVTALLDLVDLPFDPDELSAQRAGIYDQRTEINRAAKAIDAQVSSTPAPPPDLPAEEVDASTVVAELQAAHAEVARHQQLVERANAAVEAEAAARLETERLVDALNAAVAAMDSAIVNTAAARAEVDALPSPPDLTGYEDRIRDLEATNRQIRAAGDRHALVQQATSLHDQSDDLTSQLDAIDERRRQGLAAANMPIDGLSFDDDGLLYNGIPLSQCSASEQLRVSLAIAMAMNPKIRVLRITDGSLLDSASMRLVEQAADENDYQVWLEVVSETGDVGVVIEDGAVVQSTVVS